MANLYATDIAEVRLPIHDEELAHLELPLASQITGQQRPEVILRAQFAGKQHTWRGEIVRTEGEIDSKTRMITVIAQVESPYETKNDRPPLAVGLFVEAEIIGRAIGNVFVLPRSAMQTNKQVYVVGKDNRLQFRDVEILRTVGEKVYISAGFNARETVCLSTVSNAIEGMLVKPAPAPELQVSK